MRKLEIKGTLILIFVTLIWGSTFSLTKISLKYLTPFFLLFVRFFLGSLSLSIYFIAKRDPLTINWAGSILGIINFSAIAFQTFGLRSTTATKGAFITGLSVLMVPFFERIFLGSKIGVRLWFSVSIAFLGLTMLTVDFKQIGYVNWGDFLVFICALLYAIQIVYIAYVVHKKEVLDLAFSELFLTALLALLFHIFFETGSLPLKSIFISFLPVFYLGTIATSLTLTLQLIGQKYLTPTKSALIYNLEPVFATVFAFFILKESLSFIQFIGAFLILLALFISIPSSPIDN
uniref:DMT family transporter n=1 Tax=Dictyoglomus thermophilum TaxID=14 RepID=A0A7C3MKL1_DICTH